MLNIYKIVLIIKEVHIYKKHFMKQFLAVVVGFINILLVYTDLTIPAPTTAWLHFFIKTKRPSAG